MRRNIAADIGHKIFDKAFCKTRLIIFGSFQPRVDTDRQLKVVYVVPPMSGYKQYITRMQKHHVRVTAINIRNFSFLPSLKVNTTVDT